MSQTFSIDAIIPKLDGRNFILYGHVGYRREYLTFDFIQQGLEKNESVCIITLTRSANELFEDITNFSESAAMSMNEAIMNEQFNIIDMYSFRSGIPEEVIPGVNFLTTADDLTALSIAINQVIKKSSSLRIILWPLSLLAIYNETAMLMNFIQTLNSRTKNKMHTVLYLQDDSVLDSLKSTQIESLMDGKLEIKQEDIENQLVEKFRVKFFKGLTDSDLFTWNNIS